MPRSTINSQSTNLNVDRATFVQDQQVITESPVPSRQNTPTPSNIQDKPNNDNISLQEQSSPSLAQAVMLMTEELHCQDSSPPKPTPTNSKVKELLTVLTLRSSTTSSSSVTFTSATTLHTPMTTLKSLLPLLIFEEQLWNFSNQCSHLMTV